MRSDTGSRTVQAVQITLDILELLEERNGARVTELASDLGYSKGTIHSHLATLLNNEYVVKQGDTYRLGLRFLKLGRVVGDRIEFYDIVKEELESITKRCGELAQFATEEHGRAVYLYKAEGEKSVRTASAVGAREYMHCISLGKAMLAQMSEERVDEIVDRHGLPEYTPQTITDRDELHDELAEIRERGYAYDDEEKISGLRCVAAPVKPNDGFVGAISVSGPASRMEGEFYHETVPDVVTRAANVIEINSQFA
jgi:DNA-binding IclR family transcriptional regulator